MAKYKLVKTNTPPIWMRPLIPVLALIGTFILTSGLIIWSKANPFETYYQFLIGPLSTRVSALEVLVKATPLILTGAAVTFAFTSGYFNIGAEGQLYAGAIAAAGLGPILGGHAPISGHPHHDHQRLCRRHGLGTHSCPAQGKSWAVDEVVTTLLLNSVMAYIVSALLNGPWRDPASGWPQSPEIAASAHFPKLIARSRLNLGFLVAVATIIVLWFVLTRTAFGLRMRAVGLGKPAARFAGINVERTILIAALSQRRHRRHRRRGRSSRHPVPPDRRTVRPVTATTGVIIATLGGLNAWGVGLAALFFGLVDTGAQTVSPYPGSAHLSG